jgi:hypothetical protein
MLWKNGMYFEANGGGNGGGGSGDGTNGQQKNGDTFEGWLEKQPENVKSLYATHTSGLKNALETERKGRKDAEIQLRDLAKKAEKGSELEKSLTEQADKLTQLEQKNEFYDKAHSAGVRNLKLAYLAASQSGFINAKGEVDFTKLKAEFPELFLGAPPANGGNGANGTQQSKNMNDFLLQASGRSR